MRRSVMDEKRIEGAAQSFGGKVQDAVGGLTGDLETQARGKANQAVGAAQQTYGHVLDDVRAFASEEPFVALLSAMTLGIVIGFILGRS
jgi:uncharacterized protein YjbJ (UPF0337 family)